MGFELRPATTDDIPALAALCYPAWRDGHLGGVPDELDQLFAGAGHERAWLAVVATNARARRFDERHGWVEEGDFLFPADTADGTIDVPCRRYAKTVSL